MRGSLLCGAVLAFVAPPLPLRPGPAPQQLERTAVRPFSSRGGLDGDAHLPRGADSRAALWVAAGLATAACATVRPAAAPETQGAGRAPAQRGRSRGGAARAGLEAGADDLQGPEGLLGRVAGPGEQPEELLGPWELRTTLPGVGASMWVELAPDGSASCARGFGQGHSWQATQRDGKWRLQCLLLDKLKRPMRFEGKVDASDTHRLAVAGEIFGPPKRAAPGASARQLERGVLIGEFQGYVLD